MATEPKDLEELRRTDPDIAQAVEDKLPDLAEIRDAIAADVRQPGKRHDERAAELISDVTLRAERIQMAPLNLIRVVAAFFDSRNGGRQIDAAVRSKLRAEAATAVREETQAHHALTKAQEALNAATRARFRAEARSLAFGIEVRG